MPTISTFVETLKRIVADPAVAAKNALFSDPALTTLFTTRVSALTPDVVAWYGAADVASSTGDLAANVNKNNVALDIDGFEMTFSQFRDGLTPGPRKIRRRVPSDVITATPADRVQYVLADPTNGVMLLDTNLEVIRTFPGLTTTLPLVGATYADARCACLGTIGVNELMFIACGTQHCVKIINYTTGALVSTIGVAGTSGVPTDVPPHLNTPVSVSVDTTNSRLFIVCASGNIGADVTNAGFVSEWDISVPGTPTLVSVFLFGNGLYRLNNGEVKKPSDVFFQPAKPLLVPPQDARLWVANGLGDVAGFTRTLITDPWVATLVIPAQGKDYVLGPDLISGATIADNAIDVLTGSDNEGKLYVTSSLGGTVEVFRASRTSAGKPFGIHEGTFGHHGIESTLPFGTTLRLYSTPPDPPLTFGVFTSPAGVVADEQIQVDETTSVPVLIVSDKDAGRIQKLRLPIYGTTNQVTFNAAASEVPLFVMGWFLPADATFPPELLTLEVRDPGDATVMPIIPAGPWREVPRAGFSVPVQGPTLTRYQFRLTAKLEPTSAVQAYTTGAVGVLLRQAW